MAEELYKTDLRLARRRFDQQTSDRQYVDLESTPAGDLQPVAGRANLTQAVINRLLTRRGELTALGHPTYGSRLHLLVGELNNLRLRGKAELYIRESLAQEPRIAEVTSIRFAAPTRSLDRDLLQIEIRVRPRDGSGELVVSLPVNLGGGG